MGDLQEIDDFLDAMPMSDFFGQSRPIAQELPEEVRMHRERTAGHDVVERSHAAKQRDVLERAGNAAARRLVGTHLGAQLALEGDAPLLWLIEAVDDVEHRRLACAVRPDDGADFAFADVKGDVAQRFDAAEPERNVFDRQDRLAGSNVDLPARPHRRCPARRGDGASFARRLRKRAFTRPSP